MEKLLSLSAETKILLPDFRWWAQKDVDYRGNVFPDPTNPCVNALLSLKVNCNSASSQLTLRPEPPTQAPERLSSFGTTGRSTSNVEYMAAPSWFLTHMSSTGTKTNSAACKILYKDHDNKAVNKNIFYLMFFIKIQKNKHYRYCSVNLFAENVWVLKLYDDLWPQDLGTTNPNVSTKMNLMLPWSAVVLTHDRSVLSSSVHVQQPFLAGSAVSTTASAHCRLIWDTNILRRNHNMWEINGMSG